MCESIYKYIQDSTDAEVINGFLIDFSFVILVPKIFGTCIYFRYFSSFSLVALQSLSFFHIIMVCCFRWSFNGWPSSVIEMCLSVNGACSIADIVRAIFATENVLVFVRNNRNESWVVRPAQMYGLKGRIIWSIWMKNLEI
jgi:hypothetical protein